MDLSGNEHNPLRIIAHGLEEADPNVACRSGVIDALRDALRRWQWRSSHESPGLDLLRFERCPQFSISYDGEATDYWPSAADNDIRETVVRAFLFHDGICRLTDAEAHSYHARNRILSTVVNDGCLLVFPCATAVASISGMRFWLVRRL